MSELDEVSMRIGLLTGQVESLNGNMEHLISWIKDSNAELKTAMTAHDANDRQEFEKLKTKIQSLDGFKNRVMAVSALCSLIISGCGSWLLTHWWGKSS